MRSKPIIIGLVGIVVGVLLSSVVVVLAGNVDSDGAPTAPGSQMFTLNQIYDRLDTGAMSAKMETFTEPGAGPDSTGRTLDEVMAVAKPGALAPHVNKTGQTTSYAGGDDGGFEMGIDPVLVPTLSSTTGAYNTPAWTGVRFTDNGDGTVTDNLTGLIWLQNANCWGGQTWANALTNSIPLSNGECGLTDGSSDGDWRLPNINELHSLIDLNELGPALPSGHHFGGVQLGFYWSSSTYADETDYGYYVYLNDGDVYINLKTYEFYVWPVRGGH